MFARVFTLLLLLIGANCSFSARAQATVTEEEPVSLYVDAALGSDTNSGTAAAPLSSISAALITAKVWNQKNVGVHIWVRPGYYHEHVNINTYHKVTAAPLTLEAVIPWKAYITGADRITAWTVNTDGTYEASWTPLSLSTLPKGWPVNLHGISLDRQQLFVNWDAYTEVWEKAWLRPGSFYVDRGTGTVYLYPKPHVLVATADIEMSVRANTLTVGNRQNIVIRGMAMDHAASQLNQSSVNVYTSRNVLIDNVRADWNSWGGLQVSRNRNVTIQNSFANHNGGFGFNLFETATTTFNGDEADFNNWRGTQAAFYDWGQGGVKFYAVHGATSQGFRAFYNFAQGLWFDTDNRQDTITGAFVGGSFNRNVQIELNDGPITIDKSTFCYGGTGVQLVNSSHVTLSNSLFYDNGGTGPNEGEVYMAGQAGGRHFADYETGAYHNVISSHLTFAGNTVVDADMGQYTFATYQVGTDWDQFRSTLSSSNNYYSDLTRTSTFLQAGRSFPLTGWQRLTGSDQSSSWDNLSPSRVAAACALPAPGYYDFQIFSDAPSNAGYYAMSRGQLSANLQLYEYLPKSMLAHVPSASDVKLEVLDLPDGVTGRFSPMTANPRGLAFTLDLVASSSAKAGPADITVLASSNNILRTMTIPVTITPKS